MLLGLAMAGPAPARAQTTGPVPYALVSSLSRWDVGCFGPCECAIVTRGLQGSFTLTPSGTDPLYAYYDLGDIRWTIGSTPTSSPIPVTGKGRYQLGGEFAIMHRLTLDLLVDGKPVHLDSGLIPGGGEWPEIRISCPAHGFACFDTVATLDAKPANTAGVGRGDGAVALEPRPNPFRDATALWVRLATAGPADLRIFDTAGRLQRVLVAGQLLAAGERAVAWDGLRADGRAVPPGLYLARLQTPAGTSWRRLVRLR